MKKPWTERVGNFVAGKGFYIVLFLCVAAIGISGYYLFSTLSSGGEDTTVDAPAQVVVTPPAPSPSAEAAAPVVPSASPTPAATPSPTPASEAAAATSPEPSPSASAPVSSVFTWPVKGEVLYDFSLEVLAYDATMGDWRTHSGIDIAASVGTEVCAVSSGTVEQVYSDDLMGTTVMIDHGDGLRSIYSNLASTPTVVEGDTVTTGSIIGSVGETALAESGRPAHLHLEMTQDGLAIDPVSRLPE